MRYEGLSRRSFGRLLGTSALIAAVPPLRAAEGVKPIRLSANENPFGPSPAATRAMADALHAVARYPDDLLDEVTAQIAALHGVPPTAILLANGSSEVLKLAQMAFVRQRLSMADPSFEAIGNYARADGKDVMKVPLTADHAHDLEKMRDGDLVYLCNPNNPTGTITPKAKVRAFLDSVPPTAVVLVDEAYHHYAQSEDYESVVPLVKTHPNLVVARTFSKIYAMAGLRCGYAVADEPLIRRMATHQQWDSLNVVALAGARASIGDPDFVALGRKKNSDTRRWLSEKLRGEGFTHLPSEANFIMIDAREPVRPLIDALRGQGVRVGRVFPAMPDHMRVTIGTPEEMQRFFEAFRRVTRREAAAAW